MWKTMKEKIVRIAVIGAGAGGLCALRHLACKQSVKNPSIHFKAVAYEQTSRVGGTWVYTDRVGTDEIGLPVHSSMYKNLRTNLAKECMSYPDYPFPSHLPSFISHTDVQKYLEDYTSHFDLWRHIKLQRQVQLVQPIFNKKVQFGVQWEVTSVDVRTKEDHEKDIYDAVLVCNGHYAKPLLPEIPGLKTFQGNLIHSHDYREPSLYKDKTVVILGARASGQDIAVEVSAVARQVYLCHNHPKLVTNLPPNLEQKPGIKHCHPRVVEFNDGSALEIDSIILCTGYHYSFEFLSDDVKLQIEDERITPLYQHLLHCRFPNLGFVGIPKTVLPLPLFDVQIRFFRAILDGSLSLPTEQDMLEETEKDYQLKLKQGLPHRYAHTLADSQFEYNRHLVEMAGIEPLPEVHENIYNLCHILRRADVIHYRDHNFVISGDGKVELLEIKREW